MSGGKAKLVQTPSQTVGPFFAYGLTPEQYGYPTLASIASPNVLGGDLRTPDVDGERIRLVGRVLDGDGEPAGDAMIEIRSEEHTSELQSLMRISYAVFCLKKKKKQRTRNTNRKKNIYKKKNKHKILPRTNKQRQ